MELEMKNKMKFFKSFIGFTLLELVVAVSIFSIVTTIAIGLVTSSLKGERRAVAAQNVQDNARFVFDYLSKEIRTANTFSLISSSDVKYTNYLGELIEIKLNGTNIDRIVTSGSSSVTATLTTSGVSVSYLNFTLTGAGTSDNLQPKLTILATFNSSGLRPEQQTSIDMQTTISQRLLDFNL